MAVRHRTIALIVAAAIVPPFMQLLWIELAYAIGPSTLGYSSALSQIVSAGIGGAFIVAALRIYAILVLLVYLPLMVYLLVGLALTYAG